MSRTVRGASLGLVLAVVSWQPVGAWELSGSVGLEFREFFVGVV